MRRALTLIMIVLLTIGSTGTAVGQESPVDNPLETDSPTPTPTPDGQETTSNGTERIDNETVIVNSVFIEDKGVSRVTIRSETSQVITVSDAGSFLKGGKVPVRSEYLSAGETTTIEIPSVKQNGIVGVAIGTENTRLYSEIIENTGTSGQGEKILRQLDSIQAWVAGISIAFVWMSIAGWSVMRREETRPEVAS